MIGRLCDRASAPVSLALEHPRDLLVAAFSRHFDQAAIVQSVPLRIGARIEKELDRFDVSFTRGKMRGRRIPVLGASQPRAALDQLPKHRHVASRRGNERVPGVVARAGRKVVGSDHRAPAARSVSAISACPRRVAHASGVAHGSLSGRLTGAPRDSRNSTIFGLLTRAAQASGVER